MKLFVDEVELIFLVCDQAFFDFYLLDNFKVFVFEDENSVFEGHVFVDDIAIFLPDEGNLLAGQFELFKFAVHQFDSILFFPDEGIFFFHL